MKEWIERYMGKTLITIEQLSQESEIGLSKISNYVRQKVLCWEKEGEGGERYYDKPKALKRLARIKKLEKEGYDIKEIKEYFAKEDAPDMIITNGGREISRLSLRKKRDSKSKRTR